MKNFMEVKVIRGFTEIKNLYEIIKVISEKDIFICGGYVRYMCSPQLKPILPCDIDIYFTKEKYFNLLKEKLINLGLEIRIETALSVTFKRITDIDNPLFSAYPIQLIKPNNDFKTVIKDYIHNFDFTIVRCGLLSPTTALVDIDFIKDERLKILKLKRIIHPITTTNRCMKYVEKGYFFPQSQIVKLFQKWEKGCSISYKKDIIKTIESTEPKSFKSRKEIKSAKKKIYINGYFEETRPTGDTTINITDVNIEETPF